jgi:hypothetical protein
MESSVSPPSAPTSRATVHRVGRHAGAHVGRVGRLPSVDAMSEGALVDLGDVASPAGPPRRFVLRSDASAER